MSLTLNPRTIQKINQNAKASGVHLFSELASADAVTEKGAKSYSIGSHDPRVVLFMKSIRGMELRNPRSDTESEKFLEFLLEECWRVSPLDTLRLIFYIRDCRGGKGEKLIFHAACAWLMRNHLEYIRRNLEHVPFYGSWKDLLTVFSGSVLENNMIRVYTSQLQRDELNLAGGHVSEIDTGAAKYAPSEDMYFDRTFDLVSKFCSVLGVTKRQYRKSYLRPLRTARVRIVEEQMCAREWDQIDFSKVPSVAMNRYKKAFRKHCPEKFTTYISKVASGEAKINVSVLTPPEIISPYLTTDLSCYGKMPERNDVLEAQWKQFLSDRRKLRLEIAAKAGVPPVNALPVIDVSGSMYGNRAGNIPSINISVSLGLLISLLNDESSPFHRKWVTFSEAPKLEHLKGDDLHSIIKNMDHKNWQMTTDFQAVFDLLLNTAKMYNVPQESMPKMLIVISDMQFDAANRGGSKTNWEALEKKYADAGYTRPTIVFWDARGNTLDMPVPHSNVPNCSLIGGFSANLLNPLIDGEVPSPLHLMKKVIESERYSRITLPNSNEDPPGSSDLEEVVVV
jgi:hypothetical protein